jgi:hypothetical protein
MQQDYPSASPSSAGPPTYRENERCTFCQEIKSLLIEEEVYYNHGKNKRLEKNSVKSQSVDRWMVNCV